MYSKVTRFETYPDDPYKIDPSTETIVLSFPSIGHSGGSMKFGPDGYLYVGTGDGYGQGDIFQTGQDTSDLLASILRIDVDKYHPARPYSIPPDNPFIDTPGVRGRKSGLSASVSPGSSVSTATTATCGSARSARTPGNRSSWSNEAATTGGVSRKVFSGSVRGGRADRPRCLRPSFHTRTAKRVP